MPALRKGLSLAKQNGINYYVGRFNRLKASYPLSSESRDSIPFWLERARTALAGSGETTEIIEVAMAQVRYLYDQGAYERIVEIMRPHINRCKGDNPPSFCRDMCYFMTTSLDTLEQPDSAIYYANLRVAISKRYDNPADLRLSHGLLAWVQYEQGLFKESYDNLYLADQLSDTIFRADLETAIADERIRQNVAAVEEAQRLAEQKSTLLATQNRLWFGLALTLGALLLGGGLLLWSLQRARRKLKATNLQLAKLNATKDKFFGLIAHDLRSPVVALSSVGGQMQYYLEQNKTDKMSRLAQRVEQTAGNLTALLDNLLQWALLQTGMIPYRPAPVGLGEIAQENIDLYHEMMELKEIVLIQEIEEGITVFADPRAVSTMIRNLLNNALKFTPHGGAINVSAKQLENNTVLRISDTGVGMEAEQLANLFSLQKTSTRGTAGEKGTCLGLQLVQELVELNKGAINVESKVGEGSTFSIQLPTIPNSPQFP